jgi:hypothetical protein
MLPSFVAFQLLILVGSMVIDMKREDIAFQFASPVLLPQQTQTRSKTRAKLIDPEKKGIPEASKLPNERSSLETVS